MVVLIPLILLFTRTEAGTMHDTPSGYTLQQYDDCGVSGRQPHAPAGACHTFPRESVEADEPARTVTYGMPHFEMHYTGLAGGVPYVLAVTYASERGNRRIQSLEADGVSLHGPLTLPDGKATRYLFALPPQAIREGTLTLHFICNEGHNAVASVVELWAPLPAPHILHLTLDPHFSGHLSGLVSDVAYRGIAGAEVHAAGLAATTGEDGRFELDLALLAAKDRDGTVLVSARHGGMCVETRVPLAELRFDGPVFRPIAHRMRGIERTEIRLDGTWRIHPSRPEDLATDESESPGWSDFRVPGQWTQQGFDIPRDATVGVAKTFQVPSAWAGQRVFLRFEAIHGGATYWLNGTRLGSSENLFTPVEFDITDAVKPGETNRLAIAMKVDTPSELASFSSNYAFHNLGGIDRSVRIFALPPIHLKSLHCETPVDSETGDASLALRLLVDNTTLEAANGMSVRVAVKGLGDWRIPLESVRPGETVVARDFPMASPKTWNAEKPCLYTLCVTLFEKGRAMESVERRIGFRTVAVKDGQLLINGRPVKLAGANRHEIDPLTGRAATAAHAETDARLFRDANFNYVRTSHYPPAPEFLDACDRLGLYVECEAPFCWARGGHGEDDPAMAKRFVEVTAAMIECCRGHPSIILWSIANESGNGPDGEDRLPRNFAETLALCHREDPSRPVLFNNEWARDGGAGDAAVLHYPSWPPEAYSFVKDDPRPILLDECFPPQTFTFAETLRRNPGLDIDSWSGGQNGPSSFWSHVYESRNVIGLAIWAGIDEEFFLPGGKTVGYGPWGFFDVWRRPKSLAWDAKCLFSPVFIPVREAEATGDGNVVHIPVENRFAFTGLSELRTDWQLGKRKGRCKIDAPPGGKTHIDIALPRNTPGGSLLVLRFTDRSGHLIAAHGITIGHGNPRMKPEPPRSGPPKWRDDGTTITVSSHGFDFSLDKATGKIESNTVMLRNFPALFVTRFEERNVFDPGGLPYAEFPDETTRTVKRVAAEERDNALLLRVETSYTGFDGSVEMLLDAEGACRFLYDYHYSGETMTAGEIGLRLAMPPACRTIQWRRHTEWDVYPEDHIGRSEGIATTGEPVRAFTPSAPALPWHLDANEFGSRDFRSTKYHVYEAELRTTDMMGLRIESDGTADVRACVAPDATWLHLLQSKCAPECQLPWPWGPPPRKLTPNDRLSGAFSGRIVVK